MPTLPPVVPTFKLLFCERCLVQDRCPTQHSGWALWAALPGLTGVKPHDLPVGWESGFSAGGQEGDQARQRAK